MLILVGRIITNNKNTKLLVIHSKELSNRVIGNKNSISIRNYNEGLLISPKGETHVTIAKGKRLQVAITNLMKSGKISLNEKRNVFVYLDEKEWKINKNEILGKSVGSPLSKIIPSDLIAKNAGVRINNGRYYLDISSKKLHDIVKSETVKCLFSRLQDDIIIIKSEEFNARRLTPHSKKRVQIAIPKELLNKNEIAKLNKKKWLPIRLKLNLASFNLIMSDFYSIKEERELVEYMDKKGVKIKIKEPADPYDFLINNNIAVEIHNSIPKYGDLVTRHKVKPALVRLRILEANFLIKTKKVNKFFIIINKKWEEGRYIREVISKDDENIRVFFTDFKGKWYEKIGNKIINLLVEN